jgi:hypothetical protein
MNAVKNNIYNFVKCFWYCRITPPYIIYSIEDCNSEPEYIDMHEEIQ